MNHYEFKVKVEFSVVAETDLSPDKIKKVLEKVTNKEVLRVAVWLVRMSNPFQSPTRIEAKGEKYQSVSVVQVVQEDITES